MNAVIALNPQDMVDAQRTTQSWIDAKLAAAVAEVDELDNVHDAMARRGLRTDGTKALLNKAAKRVTFYEKVKAALAAGYYIIPPFNSLQVFAVRTDRARPLRLQREGTPWSNEVKPGKLPVGQGRFINPEPIREAVTIEKKNAGTPQERNVTISANVAFQDDIDLPVIARKPILIEAVGKALHEMIFDTLSIAPAYRSADPIIAGTIERPGGGSLTFFVAWWLDQSDL